MKLFLVVLAIVGLCVFGMCFNIIFRKDGKFPEYEVSRNEEMRQLGIRCMHEEDAALFGKEKKAAHERCNGEFTESCKGCALYKEHKV